MGDPSAHLKDLLNIGSPPPRKQLENPLPNPARMPDADTAKSNALLALLRGGPTAELRASPSTPLEQISFAADIPRNPQRSHPRASPSASLPPAPQLNAQTELPTSPLRTISPQPAYGISYKSQVQATVPLGSPGAPLPQSQPTQPLAPYQQTGDPDFARPQPAAGQGLALPPASALPKLTGHTKALLDVFKGTSIPTAPPRAAPLPGQTQSLLNIFKGNSASASPAPPANPSPTFDTSQSKTHSQVLSPHNVNVFPWPKTGTTIHQPRDAHQSNLLGLFGQRAPGKISPPAPTASKSPRKAPAELAATAPTNERTKLIKDEARLALLRKPNNAAAVPPTGKHRSSSTVKEGTTAATMDGPLNQPNFEAIPRTPKDTVNGMGRIPLTTHRTLFDPKQPATMKILARPEEQRQASKSPRPVKAKAVPSSPLRNTKPPLKEPPKPFQPQILRRPQTLEGVHAPPPELIATTQATNDRAVLANASPMSRDTSSEQETSRPQGMPSQAETHKQTLLSLFGGSPSGASGIGQVQTPSRVVSPLSSSQIVSPENDVPVSAIEPISTRSRMGSLASTGGAVPPARPVPEKRQTGAENKAFLLGYLGRIATQEG